MRSLLSRALRFFGLLKFDLLVESTSTLPGDAILPDGKMFVVRDGDIEKWACFTCPGGCGKIINLSLNPARRPRWGVVTDFWRRPTVQPSVHQLNACECHFWVKQGCIDWCKDGRPMGVKRD